MHRRGGVPDPGAERGADRLVAEAHPEDREVVPQPPDHSMETPASAGSPGPGEMRISVGSEVGHLFDGHLVVAVHDAFLAEVSPTYCTRL